VKKGTILIIEHDAHHLQVLRDYFEKAGHRALTATDATNASAFIRLELPQAVILDLDTPGLDAAALTKELRASPRTRHIHIALLTPRGEREDKLAALAAGADEFLSKPVDVDELALRIRNALRRASFNNLTNPVTGLPGPRLIEEQLRALLRRIHQEDWAILRLSLNGFKAFGDMYGFLAGEEVLRFAAQMFAQVVDRLGAPDDFIGHSGGDSFVIVGSSGQMKTLADELCARFAEDVKTHYSFRDRERGYLVVKDSDGNEEHVPLMTLSARLITSADGPFSDIRELTQALG
jgi:diguanylate cyclase (GGDEF)-like protein